MTTIPRGTPQPDGVFGRRVAAALSAKGGTAPEQTIIDAAERLIDSRQRNGVLRLLTLQPPGKKAMSVPDLLNSRRDWFEPGTQLH